MKFLFQTWRCFLGDPSWGPDAADGGQVWGRESTSFLQGLSFALTGEEAGLLLVGSILVPFSSPCGPCCRARFSFMPGAAARECLQPWTLVLVSARSRLLWAPPPRGGAAAPGRGPATGLWLTVGSACCPVFVQFYSHGGSRASRPQSVCQGERCKFPANLATQGHPGQRQGRVNTPAQSVGRSQRQLSGC